MWLSILLLGVIGILLMIAKVVNSRPNIEQSAATANEAKPNKIRKLPPGPKPTDSQHGNRPDILAAGSLHEYLLSLHKQYGHILSFHIGPELYISISSRELLQDHTKLTNRMPNRPTKLLEHFTPVWGMESLATVQNNDWTVHRHRYEEFFTPEAVENYYAVFQEVADEFLMKFSQMPPEEHLPLSETMLTITAHAVTRNLFGIKLDANKYAKYFSEVWAELERRMSDDPPPVDSDEQKHFEQSLAAMWEIIRSIIKQRRENGPGDQELVIDSVLNNAETEREAESELHNFLVAGMHTTGYLITWVIYLLASHPDIEEKTVKELNDVLGEDKVVPSNLPLLEYMRQILDETMRWSNIVTFSGRVTKEDVTLGGYDVPGETPVIHAFGVMNRDADLWTEPDKFDPDRFSPEKVKDFPTFALEPFGVGRRKCIGFRIAYAEATVVLATLLRKFHFKLVEGQDDVIVYGFLSTPRDEVWVTIEQRQ